MNIYKITNLLNGKIYIGKQVKDNKNYFGSGKLIKLAIQKYGIHNFKKEILEICESHEALCEREKFWIEELNSRMNGYNIAEGGTGGDTTSTHPNKQEIVEKRRVKNLGKKRSPEFCELMKVINKNRDPEVSKRIGKEAAKTKKERWDKQGYSDKEKAARILISQQLSNYNKLESTRSNVSCKLKGKKKKPFTDEHKKNIGLASKGRPGSNLKEVSIFGVVYVSLHNASRELNVPVTTIRARLLNPKFTEWFYV